MGQIWVRGLELRAEDFRAQAEALADGKGLRTRLGLDWTYKGLVWTYKGLRTRLEDGARRYMKVS